MLDKILVTGGAGFIGSHIAEHLVKQGKKVIVIDDLSGGFRDNVPEDAEFIEGNILNVKLLENLFKQNNITHVYHLAAYAAEGLSHFIKRFNYNNNLIGSVNLINLAVNCNAKCFVFTSSIAVYGSGQEPFSENITPAPEDSYGIAKYAVEQELKISHEMFGLNYIIFRPHNVYGERQNIGDRYRNVIGIFMNQLMNGEALTIFGDGKQTRAFSYIDDVALPIANSGFMIKCYNKTFNIGADQPYSVATLGKVVAEQMGKIPKIQYLEARNEVKHAYSDHAKSKKYFSDFITNVSLDEGIKRMADWVK
ncbi:MAG: NAD-dependent epimerase/dehydratase family protein, partial [Mariniphaga sp.]|nr:NAD-dependent epimerase/dehydratase family protein [Mariniphaga sp.]